MSQNTTTASLPLLFCSSRENQIFKRFLNCKPCDKKILNPLNEWKEESSAFSNSRHTCMWWVFPISSRHSPERKTGKAESEVGALPSHSLSGGHSHALLCLWRLLVETGWVATQLEGEGVSAGLLRGLCSPLPFLPLGLLAMGLPVIGSYWILQVIVPYKNLYL